MAAKIASTAAVAAALLVVALTGCGNTTGDAEPAAPPTGMSGPYGGQDTPVSEAGLRVAESELGEIVVDGEGRTVYMFDNDTQGGGASTCEGQCAQNWPAVTTDGDAPTVDGITGEVGTITGVDGAAQVTLNGWPLYYFAGDTAPGDVAGQGVNDVWWVLSPAGERMTG